MGVYIKDAKMPKGCTSCGFVYYTFCPCGIGSDLAINFKTTRHPDCPLVEISDLHIKAPDKKMSD